YRVWGYNDETLTHQPVDLVNRYPLYGTLGSGGYIPDYTSLNETLNRFVSIYANAAFVYKKRFTVSGSLRRDASNLFGVATNNRWKPLWSAGIAYSISDEPFYRIAFLPKLRIKATY